MTRMDGQPIPASHQTHIFVLRIWSVTEGATAPQWRSRLQDIQSGEVNYFKDLEALHNFINERLHEEKQETLNSHKDEK